jgi:hypothetical protein
VRRGHVIVFTNMLYHYVEAHCFCPSEEVWEAIRRASNPLSKVLTYFWPWRYRRAMEALKRLHDIGANHWNRELDQIEVELGAGTHEKRSCQELAELPAAPGLFTVVTD